MSFLPNIFSGSNKITTEDIDSYISNISQNIDIQSNILELQEASSQYSNYICQKALPAVFNALIQSKMNDDIIADIFQIINNCITDSEYSSSNALLIVDYDLSLPAIIDCIDTEKPKKKIAVIQIITKLGILQPSQLQQHLINEQDRLVHFLTLIDDPNPEVVHDFLALLPILVLNNSDFQQLFAFNIMEKLMKLIENKTPLAISSLRALLSANTTTQNLFFGTVENLSIIASLLENEEPDTLSLFIEIFSSPNASNYRHFLKEANLIQIILTKSLNGNQQFIRLLGLSIKKEPDFCKLIRENENLSKFLNMYFQSNDEIADMYFLSLFKSFLYQSDESCYALSDLIITIDDRNEPKLIKLATLTIMSGPDSKTVFLSNSPNFTSSMIGFFISHINFELVLHFLIVLCWESRNSCLEFQNEPSEPVSFLRQFLPNESPLIHAQCCLLLRILHYVLDPKEANQNQNENENDDIEQLNIQIRDFSTYLSTLEANDYYDFIRQIISVILNEPITPRETEKNESNNKNENETKTADNSENESDKVNSNASEQPNLNQKEAIIEEEEEEPENQESNNNTNNNNYTNNKNINIDENEEAIANYDQMVLEMKNKSIEDQIKLENELRKAKDEINKLKAQLISAGSGSSTDSELIQRQFDEFREQQNEEIARINSKNLEEKEIIERNYKNEIDSLQSQILTLQSNLDAVTASSEKEVAELKQKIVSTEIECAQKVGQMKNMNRESFAKQIEELRDQCESMKRDLGILRSQHKALFAQQIEEFKDEQSEFQKIVDENKSLKFRISQLLKENEHFKSENQQQQQTDEISTRTINFSNVGENGSNDLIVSLKAQINDLQSQNHSLLQKDSDNQREISNLKRENMNAKEIRQNWESYINDLNDLKSENDSIKNQLSQASSVNNELQKTIDSNQEKIDDLSNRYSEAQKVATSVQALVELNCKLQNDLDKANSQNIQMEVDLNILKSRSSNKQLIDLMNQNSELKKTVFDADQIRAQNSELQKTADALKKDNSAFRSQILDFERKVARLETENNFLKDQTMTFTNQFQNEANKDDNNNNNSNNNNSHLIIQDLNSKIVGLNEQLSAIQSTDINKKLEQENNDLKQQILQTAVKVSTLQDENAHLKQIIKKEQQERESLHHSSDFSAEDSVDIDSTIESLKQNNDELVSKINDKDKENSMLKVELKATQDQLRKQIKNDNENREKEMSTLRTFLTSNTSKFKILTDIKNRVNKESSRLAQLIIATKHLSSQGQIINERSVNLSNNNNNNNNNNDEIEELRVNNNLLKETVKDLNKRIERLTRDNTKLAKHASNLTSKFREVSKENNFLKNNSVLSSNENLNENDKQQSKSLIVSKSPEVMSLHQQIEFAKSERERQEEHILSLINQNKALIAQVAELNSSFTENSSHNEIIRLRDENGSLHNEASELKEKCRYLENEKFVAMQQKAATIEQLRNAMSDLRALQETFLDLQEKYNKMKKKHLKLKMKIENNELVNLKRQKSPFNIFGRNRDLSYDFGMNGVNNSFFNDLNLSGGSPQSFAIQSPNGKFLFRSAETDSPGISPSHSESELNHIMSPVTPHLFPRKRAHYQSLDNMKMMNQSDSSNSLPRRSSSDQNLNESYLMNAIIDDDKNEKINNDNKVVDDVDVDAIGMESEIEPFSHFSPQEFLEGSQLDFLNEEEKKQQQNDLNENDNIDNMIDADAAENEKELNDLDLNDFNNSDIQNKSLFAEGNEPPLYSENDNLMQYIGSMSMLNSSDISNEMKNNENEKSENKNQEIGVDDYFDHEIKENDDNEDYFNQDFYQADAVDQGTLGDEKDEFGDDDGETNDLGQKKALRVIGQLWLKNQNK